MATYQRQACTSILIGKKATTDGSVMIGRNEDSQTAWPKHLQFYPHREVKQEPVFKSKANQFTLTLPKVSYQYSATPEWTDRYGVFAEGGINEYQVALSATESAYSNAEVLAVDPFVTKTGLLEEAIVTVVLPYVKTAQEAVERLGRIVNEKGSAEANGILIADQDEAWYFEIGSGHQWIAQRIPDDGYAVVANQLAIETVDFDSDDFITAPHLADFVKTHHLWPKNQPFNFRRIFGTADQSDLVYNTPRVWRGQQLLTPSVKQEPQCQTLPFIQYPDYPITVSQAQAVLSDHYQNTPYDLMGNEPPIKRFRPISVATTQESHVLQIRPNQVPKLRGIHWLAMGVSAQSVYVPFYSSGLKVPPLYTRGKATYQPRSAYWIFKEAGVLVDRNPYRFAQSLQQTQTTLRQKLGEILHTTDQKITGELPAEEQQQQIDAANQKMAAVAIKDYQELISHLITQQTADSPLNFKIDPNL